MEREREREGKGEGGKKREKGVEKSDPQKHRIMLLTTATLFSPHQCLHCVVMTSKIFCVCFKERQTYPLAAAAARLLFVQNVHMFDRIHRQKRLA